MALVTQTIPFASVTSFVLPALSLLLDQWRAKGTRVNWWTLNYIRELAQRIGSPDPAGWRETPSTAIHPFTSPLDLAVEVEKMLASSARFVLERYRNERRHDRTMEQLWVETLLFLSPGCRSMVSDVLDILEAAEDISTTIMSLSIADDVLGGSGLFVDFLRKMSQGAHSPFVAFACRCILAKRDEQCAISCMPSDLEPGAILNHCHLNVILSLPCDSFYVVASSIIQSNKRLESRTFSLILEGLRRLFDDTRNISISSTTMFGYLEVAVQTDPAGSIRRPWVATDAQLAFLSAIYTSSEVWQARTSLWHAYGLGAGRASLGDLIGELRARTILLSRLLVLLSFRVFHSQEEEREASETLSSAPLN